MARRDPSRARHRRRHTRAGRHATATVMVRTLGEAYGLPLDQPFGIEPSWAS